MISTNSSDTSSSKGSQTNTSTFDPATFDEYAGLYENMLSWSYRKDLELPTLKNLLGDISGLKILDFGCGPGVISRWLHELGANSIVGFDISEGMINYARRREEKEKAGIKYITNIDESYNEQFDVVLGVYVMPYSAREEDLLAMSKTMARVLKPGGRLITLPIHPDFSSDPEYYRPFGIRLIEEKPRTDGSPVQLHICHPPYDVSVGAYYWSRETMDKTLHDAGFQSVTWKSLDAPTGSPSVDLTPYIQCPHAAIIECIKGKTC